MAKRTVPQPIFDYVDGAAWDEVTVRRNRTGFERFELLPRMLVDVSRHRDVHDRARARDRAADHRRPDRA